MANIQRTLHCMWIALGLALIACGGRPATPTPPPPTATVPAVPTARPTASPTPIPLAPPTLIAPVILPTPAATIEQSPGCTNRYAFVSDVSIPDNTAMTPGQVFTKTWRVRNTGTCTWGGGYTLAFVRGQAMTTLPSVSVPRTAPGAEVDLSVLMNAPQTPGTYQGFWALKNPGGFALTPNLYVKIMVR